MRRSHWRRPDRLLFLTLGALVALVVGGAVLFHARLGLSALDSFYFVSTIVTTVGFGDFSLRDADALTKVAGIVTMFLGLGLSAILVALLTNELVARRAQVVRGRFRWRLRDHVVVCGLGTIGLRIALALRELGEDVVVIEADSDGRFVPAARSAGAKLVIGDAAQEESLLFANVHGARALVAVTSSDYRNLEIALTARSLAPEVPLVLRMFDPDLSRRVAASFGIQSTFSGATLGAGRFTAFAVDGTRVASLQFAGEPYALHQVAGVSGETAAACARRLGGEPLAILDASGAVDLECSGERALGEGESLLVVVVRPHS
jgi:voltage-gated potassium channel Kch